MNTPDRQPRYVDLPTGHTGWGVLGDSLANAISTIVPIERLDARPLPQPLPGPLLQGIGYNLKPEGRRGLTARRHVGYAVFENDYLVRRVAADALKAFDVVAVACQWCNDILRDAGLTDVLTVHHGVDHALFSPAHAIRRRFHDSFVVFSGGKFELRKGQDVVARAFRLFADRHDDAILLSAWDNMSLVTAASMGASPHLPFTVMANETLETSIRHWLVSAGVDLRRVELVPPLLHSQLPTIYGDCDVAVFPSRCEGATNLMLMEAMACGCAVIATDYSGHRDLLTDDNSYRLQRWRPTPISRDGHIVACWCEPDVEEVLDCLERAYTDRQKREAVGRRASEHLQSWTWARAAHRFVALMDGAES